MTPKIFLSWSGLASETFAVQFRDVLKALFRDKVEAFVSKGIGPGQDWLAVIREELVNTTYGIVCVTPSNKFSEWLHFEAGAISNLRDPESRNSIPVAVVLLELESGDIRNSPISKFQAGKPWNDDFLMKIIDVVRIKAGRP